MERKCGECTACCKTHGVFEIQKMAGTWCPHSVLGKGCSIYADRPKECRDFSCAWLAGFIDEQYRPDKTNIVPEYRAVPGVDTILWLWEVRKCAIRSKFANEWTLHHLMAGNCVMQVPLVEPPALFLPEKLEDLQLTLKLAVGERMVAVVPFTVSKKFLS